MSGGFLDDIDRFKRDRIVSKRLSPQGDWAVDGPGAETSDLRTFYRHEVLPLEKAKDAYPMLFEEMARRLGLSQVGSPRVLRPRHFTVPAKWLYNERVHSHHVLKEGLRPKEALVLVLPAAFDAMVGSISVTKPSLTGANTVDYRELRIYWNWRVRQQASGSVYDIWVDALCGNCWHFDPDEVPSAYFSELENDWVSRLSWVDVAVVSDRYMALGGYWVTERDARLAYVTSSFSANFRKSPFNYEDEASLEAAEERAARLNERAPWEEKVCTSPESRRYLASLYAERSPRNA